MKPLPFTWARSPQQTAAVVLVAITLFVLGGCGGGSDIAEEQPTTTTEGTAGISVVTSTDIDGWHFGVIGASLSEVTAIEVNGRDVLPALRQMTDASSGHILDVRAADGNAVFFSSMRQLVDDSLLIAGRVSVETGLGRSDYTFDLTGRAPSQSVGVKEEGREMAAAVNSSSIWAAARKLAMKGSANAAIKAYMRSKGYICPPGPWWLCARPAG